jgi:hypothetical protein
MQSRVLGAEVLGLNCFAKSSQNQRNIFIQSQYRFNMNKKGMEPQTIVFLILVVLATILLLAAVSTLSKPLFQ